MTDLPPFDLDGAAAFVTGAGSGIGRAIARELAGRGARVLVTDVDEQRADVVAGEITTVVAPRARSAATSPGMPSSRPPASGCWRSSAASTWW